MAWAARTQSVNLVKKDDTRGRVASSLEDLSDGSLALSHILCRQTEIYQWVQFADANVSKDIINKDIINKDNRDKRLQYLCVRVLRE